MSFGDTYREEVIASRRDRSRRAFFWAKVTSIALMLTVAVTLRAEPELHRLLMSAGMDRIMKIADLSHGAEPQVLASPPVAIATPTVPAASPGLPRSRVKVNRPDGNQAVTPSSPSLAQQSRRQTGQVRP